MACTDEDAGDLFSYDRLRALLVLGVEEREEEADRDGLDPGCSKLARCGADGLLVELDQRFAVGRNDALGHREPQAPWHERILLPRQLLVQREVPWALVASDVQHVAEALCGDHPRPGAVVLEHDVRDDGRAVEEGRDIGWREARLLDQLRGAGEGRRCRIGRGRRHLEQLNGTVLAREDEVGECPTYIDADPVHSGLLVWAAQP